ncbi:hypothetical protein L7F22_010088 [Adiantum nelumboides]|nr:hypothetical protein [Adiantum nelumboides]
MQTQTNDLDAQQRPRLKVVVRRLPPNVPEDVFWRAVEPWVKRPGTTGQGVASNVDWTRFVPGKIKDGVRRGAPSDARELLPHTHARAYPTSRARPRGQEHTTARASAQTKGREETAGGGAKAGAGGAGKEKKTKQASSTVAAGDAVGAAAPPTKPAAMKDKGKGSNKSVPPHGKKRRGGGGGGGGASKAVVERRSKHQAEGGGGGAQVAILKRPPQQQ